MIATQLNFTGDILSFACKTKQPLFDYQLRQETTYIFKNTSPGGSHFMYFDFESLIIPVVTCSNTSDRISNEIFERQ